MIEVTDDLLNKFIEGELDSDSVKEITDAVNKNEELRIRLNALQKVHEELKKIKIKETRSDFTSLIMSKITKPLNFKKSDKAFILSISSILGIFSLAIVGITVYYAVMSLGKTGTETSLFQTLFSYSKNLSNIISGIFSKGSISVIGSIFSFILIITGYFFFESRKRINTNHG